MRLQEVAEQRVRRAPRRAGGDRARDRRRARASCPSRASTPTCSSTASTRRTGTSSTTRPTGRSTTAPSPASIRRARPSSRSWRSPRSSWASARRAAHDHRPGLLHLRRPALPRLQGRRPRRGRPAQVDRGLLRHLLLHARERHGHRRDRRASWGSSASAAHRHRHRTARPPACCPRRNGSRQRFKRPEQQKWYPGETISIGIGQGYNAYTPMQLAQAMATLANERRDVPAAHRRATSTTRAPASAAASSPSRCSTVPLQARARRVRQARDGRRQHRKAPARAPSPAPSTPAAARPAPRR